MANRVIFNIGWVVDKACVYTMKVDDKGSLSLMICRGHIRVSKGALKIFLWLTVVCEN